MWPHASRVVAAHKPCDAPETKAPNILPPMTKWCPQLQVRRLTLQSERCRTIVDTYQQVMALVGLITMLSLLFGCSPALAALLAPPPALRDVVKNADAVTLAMGCADVTLASTVELSGGCLRACAPVSAGEELLTWTGILSAEDVYKDMDVGLPLRRLAEKCGPGFETIALSGLLGAEYLRGYRTRKPEALLEGGGAEAFTDLIESRWHELTEAIWMDESWNESATACSNPRNRTQPPGSSATQRLSLALVSPIDPEVQHLVNMGVDLLVPVFESTMRRATHARSPPARRPPRPGSGASPGHAHWDDSCTHPRKASSSAAACRSRAATRDCSPPPGGRGPPATSPKPEASTKPSRRRPLRLHHGQSAPLGSARARLLHLLRVRLAARAGSALLGQRPGHWAPSHGPRCSR